MSDERDPNLDALDRLVDEARREPEPDIDWKSVETRLLERVAQGEAQPAAAPRRPLWSTVASLAAAAALIIVGARALTPAEAPVPVATAPTVEPSAPRVFDSANVSGGDLMAGDRIVAAAHDVRVQHDGHATWTLARGGEAVLARTGERLTVSLTRGSVLCKVVPSPKPESFAIEVDHTRVAVHGTEFRVTRQASHARVEVTEGVVAVGPTDSEPTEGWRLTAGDRGTFSLDGKSGDVTRATAAAPDVPNPEAPTSAPKPTMADAIGKAELEAGLDRVIATTSRCFDRHTGTEAGVRVTARTRVTLSVSAAGTASVSFDPPLAPQVQQCAAGSAAGLRFARTKRGGNAVRSALLGP